MSDSDWCFLYLIFPFFILLTTTSKCLKLLLSLELKAEYLNIIYKALQPYLLLSFSPISRSSSHEKLLSVHGKCDAFFFSVSLRGTFFPSLPGLFFWLILQLWVCLFFLGHFLWHSSHPLYICAGVCRCARTHTHTQTHIPLQSIGLNSLF